MSKKIPNFFANSEHRLRKLIFALMAGVLLMFAGNLIDKDVTKESPSPKAPDLQQKEPDDSAAYERQLEERLTNILSRAEGVGKVSVLVSISSKGEIELAKDVTYEKTETAEKASVTERREIKHVLMQGKDGNNEPIIIKQMEPKIEGIIIVTEGGDDAAVKARLTKAAGALLNLPAHKIEVLKMKEE